MSLIDTHCHLNYAPLSDDVAATVQRAHAAGVSRMVNIGTQASNFTQTLQAATDHQQVYASIGLHPCHAEEDFNTPTYRQQFEDAMQHPKVVAVGETGLDFFHQGESAVQHESFLYHINAAVRYNKALVVHCRNAADAVLGVLNDTRVCHHIPVIIHCFSGNATEVQQFVAAGAYISIAGIVTFKNAKDLQQAATLVPNDRLLVETDAPYLAPTPHRGKPCDIAHIVHTAQALAQLRGVSFDELAAYTTQNAYRVFGW